MVCPACGFIHADEYNNLKSCALFKGIGSVRKAQSLLNTVPKNQAVVGALSGYDLCPCVALTNSFDLSGGHNMVIVYSTRKHAYFAILKGMPNSLS